MTDPNRLFSEGRANPYKFGIPFRSSAGHAPNPQRTQAAAALLGRPVFLVDPDGYECEILAAAVHPTSADIAYVESRAKELGPHVDISIRIHLVQQNSGRHDSADIKSYNPFFGCDVRYFEWIGPTAVLIYQEKHWTYACRFGDTWPPKFVKIEDDWTIDGDVLSYAGYKEASAHRLSFPALRRLGLMHAAAERMNETFNTTNAVARWRTLLRRLWRRGGHR